MGSDGQADVAVPGSLFDADRRRTSLGLLVLITLIAFEAMAVAPALPTVARELHGVSAYGWAFTGFLVANVIGMVVSGGLSDSRGPARPLLAGLIGFCAGLAISGSAFTMAQFVLGRVVQGLSGGLLVTALYVVIGEAYPEALRPKLFAAISTAWVVPALIGPLIAGSVTQSLGWRWVFLGLLPLVVGGSLMVLPTVRTLRGSAARDAGRDDRSRTVRAVAVAAGVAALEQAGQHPSALSAGLAVVGLGVGAWGLRALLPAGTIRIRPGVPAPIALRGLLAGSFFGIEAIVPLSMTVQHGFTPTESGLPLAGAGLSWALGSWWQGRDAITTTDQRVRLVRLGFGCIAVAAGLVAVAVAPGSPGWLIYPAWFVAGIGAGLTMSSVGVLLLNYTNDRDRGTDTAALQLSDAVCSALTTGLAGVLVAAAARNALSYTAAFATVAVAMAAVAVAGAGASGRLRPPVPPVPVGAASREPRDARRDARRRPGRGQSSAGRSTPERAR